MIADMPPEDLPPLAPFPDLLAVPRSGSDSPAGDPPLLSEAQRKEFARVADSLEGRVQPERVDEPVIGRSDDFLLSPATENADPLDPPRASFLEEEPVMGTDLLAVPGDTNGDAGSTADSFSLQNLAAALTTSAVRPAAIADSAQAPEDWDLPPFLAAAGAVSAPAPVIAPAIPVRVEPVPVAVESPSLLPADIAVPVLPAPVPAVAPAIPSFTAAPIPFPQFPPPKKVEPEPDFDEPLAFPAPSVEGLPASAAVEEIANANDRGIGMVLSGALLIILGMFLACRVPSLALEADAAAVSSHALADVRVAHLHGEMFVCAAGAAACLLLGIGSATLRRWAPPLIHAAGWVALLTVLVCMAAATASMFHLSSNRTAGDAVPGDGTAIFIAAGILGIGLPLGLIALFQRPAASRLCFIVDKKPRWTDRRTVPALMVFITGILVTVAALTLSIAGAGVPLFGEIRNGDTGALAWAGFGIAAAIAAGFAAAGKRTGWWLLLLLSCTASVALFLTCRQHDWHQLFQLPGPVTGSIPGGIMAASPLFPAILILLMTRRNFLHEYDQE